jgi:hypothetical protein
MPPEEGGDAGVNGMIIFVSATVIAIVAIILARRSGRQS